MFYGAILPFSSPLSLSSFSLLPPFSLLLPPSTHVTRPCSIMPPNSWPVICNSFSGNWGKNLYSSNIFRSMHTNRSCVCVCVGRGVGKNQTRYQGYQRSHPLTPLPRLPRDSTHSPHHQGYQTPPTHLITKVTRDPTHSSITKVTRDPTHSSITKVTRDPTHSPITKVTRDPTHSPYPSWEWSPWTVWANLVAGWRSYHGCRWLENMHWPCHRHPLRMIARGLTTKGR